MGAAIATGCVCGASRIMHPGVSLKDVTTMRGYTRNRTMTAPRLEQAREKTAGQASSHRIKRSNGT